MQPCGVMLLDHEPAPLRRGHPGLAARLGGLFEVAFFPVDIEISIDHGTSRSEWARDTSPEPKPAIAVKVRTPAKYNARDFDGPAPRLLERLLEALAGDLPGGALSGHDQHRKNQIPHDQHRDRQPAEAA